MQLRRYHKILVVVLVILIVCLGTSLSFLEAVHAGCLSQTCKPCLQLLKLQDIIRQLGGLIVLFTGFWTALMILRFVAQSIADKQRTYDLFSLKMRLNN